MKVLIGHNHYQTPGGEDAVVLSEHAMLRDFGHEVRLYTRSNNEIDAYSAWEKIKHLSSLGWSDRTYREVRGLIREFNPDVAHFHNIFYMISPSVYAACCDEGVPVVQSQHNFRLVCANALFYRGHHVCEDCLERSMLHGVYHGCYKNSRVLTAFVAAMLSDQWRQRTWFDRVDQYITASEFGRQKLIRAGLPEEKIAVKPNFLYPDLGARDKDEGYALYVGRLSEEKGLRVLLEAWRALPGIPLRIMGNGPLTKELKAYAAHQNIRNVEFLGYLDQKQYELHLKGAMFVVVPSTCYENFPRIIAEVYSCGVPVLASRLGSLQEIVKDGETGRLFRAGDPCDLAEKASQMADDSGGLSMMGRSARQEFEAKYTARTNHDQLINIYRGAIARFRGKKYHQVNCAP